MAAIEGLIEGFFRGKNIRHAWEDRKRNIGREAVQDQQVAETHNLNLETGRGNNRRADNVDSRAERQDGRLARTHNLNMRVGESNFAATEAERARQQAYREEEEGLLNSLFGDPTSTTLPNTSPATTTRPSPASVSAPAPAPAAVPVVDPMQPTQPAPAAAPTTPAAASNAPPVVPVATSSPAGPSLGVAPTQDQSPILSPANAVSAVNRQRPAKPTTEASGRRKEIAAGKGADEKLISDAERADMAEEALLAGVAPNGQPLTPETSKRLSRYIASVDERLGIDAGVTDPAIPENTQAGYTPTPATPRTVTRQETDYPFRLNPSNDGSYDDVAGAERVSPVAADGYTPSTPPPTTGTRQDTDYPFRQSQSHDGTLPPPVTRVSPIAAMTGAPAQPVAPQASSTPQPVAAVPDATPATPASPLLGKQDAPRGAPKVDPVPAAATPIPADAKPGTAPAMSPEQVERGRTALKQEATVGAAERLQNFYLRKGEPEKAEAIMAFMERQETQDAVESWTSAVFAAQIGDDAGFEKNIADVYNRHLQDGYEVVQDGEVFVRDKDGNITGAEIEFRSLQTGEVFVRTIDDVSTLYSEAINALSPAAIFEHQWAQYEAATAIRNELLAAQAKDRAKVDNPTQAEYLDRVLEVAADLADMGTGTETADELISQAQALISAGSATANPQAGGDIPRYRP